MKAFVLLLAFFATTAATQAISGAPQFSEPAQAELYSRMTRIIRCPTCQNQDINESNAPLAKQLRQLIAAQIQAGKNEQQITDYLVARYGDFITYDPRVKKSTLILWYAPAGIMLIALLSWLAIRKIARPDSSALTAEEQSQLNNWLAQYRK